MGQEARLSGLPLLQTHYGVKVEAWPQRSSPCFCAKVSKERFAKVSSNTLRPHTPCRFKFTLCSLTQVTVLHFVLRLSFYQTHDFLKMSSVSHPATVFLCCYLSCTRNLTKPRCFGEELEWKIFPGAQPPDPLPSSDTTQTPTPATPLNTQVLRDRAFLYFSLFSLVTVWLKFTQEMSRAGRNKLTLRSQFPNKGMQVIVLRPKGAFWKPVANWGRTKCFCINGQWGRQTTRQSSFERCWGVLSCTFHGHLMRQSKAANTRVYAARADRRDGPRATAPAAACRSIDVRPVDVLSRLLALAVTCWLERKRTADPRRCSFFLTLWKAANLDY